MSLLPPNATAQERAIEAAVTRLGNVPIGIDNLWNPDACPLALLPWLAWGLSVDDWDSAWTEDQKRQVIKQAVSTQRIKGTRASVQRSLNAYGNRSLLWEPQDDSRLAPFTFRVDVEIRDRAVDLELDYQKSFDTIERTKNVRSHLTELEIVATNDGVMRINTAAQAGEFGSVYPYFGGSVASFGTPVWLLAGIICEIGSVFPGPLVPIPPPTTGTLEAENGSGSIQLESGESLDLDGYVTPTATFRLLLDQGGLLLLENGTSYFLLDGNTTPPPPSLGDRILKEDGGLILLEDGSSSILIDGAGTSAFTNYVLLENGSDLLLENGSGKLLLS